jgi:nucleoside phosphorylase
VSYIIPSNSTIQELPHHLSFISRSLSHLSCGFHLIVLAYKFAINRGYSLWTSPLGGVTPCYTVLPTPLSITPPPPSTATSSLTLGFNGKSTSRASPQSTSTTATSPPATTTSILNNIYYSVPYPVQPPAGSKLSESNLVVIGALSGLVGLALPAWFIARRRLRRKKPGLDRREKNPSSSSSSSSSSSLNFGDYTVAWIAPLEIEAISAVYMLDHVHEGNFSADRGDDYVYTAGDINGHNVIIATFPAGHSYGVGSAAALASQIKKSFPNLWFGLLVGVAAGLPSADPPRDIRLGDVLVGEGEHGSAGLVSYGFGKETSTGFQHNGAEPKTAMLVSSAIASIKILGPGHEDVFLQYYESIKDKEHNNGGTFEDPGQARDQLYSKVSRDNPVAQPIVRRRRLPKERTKVWYGRIGSGDKLMKDAQKRDELRDTYNLIGLEMEAAGIMNTIPVGVIRGVCDYGDEHKNSEWQPYAAAMAAAYAKALLCKIDPKTKRREDVASA